MDLNPGLVRIRWKKTCRLIPSRYPATGILDRIAGPEDLPWVFELESWTNDRISSELSVLHRIPESEWVTGPQSTVVMAAFCHPRAEGGRFNSAGRGAWYAARRLETAHAEIIFHRTAELEEIGVLETMVQMRLYLADFAASFHDLRGVALDPGDYGPTQKLSARLLEAGSNGVVYRSVRDAGSECMACFRPRLVGNVRPDAHFEYRWSGSRVPAIRLVGQIGNLP